MCRLGSSLCKMSIVLVVFFEFEYTIYKRTEEVRYFPLRLALNLEAFLLLYNKLIDVLHKTQAAHKEERLSYRDVV